jgi:uncharacterized protein (TIGR02453 family)
MVFELSTTMPTTPNLEPILRFLDELRQHNDRAWFEAHRPDYAAARATFEQFVAGLIVELRASDPLEGLAARDCIARIHRDVRFAKDKSPYKTNMAAMIAPRGWRTTALGYYVSVSPHGQSLVAGGLYNPTTEHLQRFRQAIDRDAAVFKRITGAADFVATFGPVAGDRLKTAPKGYDRAHPELELLQLKQITALHRFSEPEVLANDFAERVVVACRAMKPFLDYLGGLMR